jgi:hypothetical protein
VAKLQLQNVSGTNVQKILTTGGQIITTTPTNTGQKLISTSNLQQLLSQQKIVVGQNQVQKVLVAAPSTQQQQQTQVCVNIFFMKYHCRLLLSSPTVKYFRYAISYEYFMLLSLNFFIFVILD